MLPSLAFLIVKNVVFSCIDHYVLLEMVRRRHMEHWNIKFAQFSSKKLSSGYQYQICWWESKPTTTFVMRLFQNKWIWFSCSYHCFMGLALINLYTLKIHFFTIILDVGMMTIMTTNCTLNHECKYCIFISLIRGNLE